MSDIFKSKELTWGHDLTGMDGVEQVGEDLSEYRAGGMEWLSLEKLVVRHYGVDLGIETSSRFVLGGQFCFYKTAEICGQSS